MSASHIFRRLAAVAAVWLMIAAGAAARVATPDEALADAALEARAQAIDTQLRCVVCQSQSIADSEAPLARDLRRAVRERLAAGDSDAAAVAFIVERYGDYVLLKPPLKPSTAALWAGPALFAALGLIGGGLYLRRIARSAVPE